MRLPFSSSSVGTAASILLAIFPERARECGPGAKSSEYHSLWDHTNKTHLESDVLGYQPSRQTHSNLVRLHPGRHIPTKRLRNIFATGILIFTSATHTSKDLGSSNWFCQVTLVRVYKGPISCSNWSLFFLLISYTASNITETSATPRDWARNTHLDSGVEFERMRVGLRRTFFGQVVEKWDWQRGEL